MDSWVIVIFLIIYALIVPWFVNWIILNRQNKKVGFLKSFHYLEKKFSTKEKFVIIFVEFILVITLLYGYTRLNISQLYRIFYLFSGILIVFLFNYLLKISLRHAKSKQISFND
ncbi:hypothetical protein Metig_1121 [Methanotorris igneus Kol 5]|uniref:DUF3784 domain-containing protein n=1 Tax=Methanotorris igneus (strain DSM 5666 / JCM 11834 / Kol 5) TaxID=880724 RepID=F6BDU9_METIK|nr:hypothetical protein Metig_1121 [Methanotorris igneus Kol 5]